MKTLHQTAESVATHLVDAMPLISDLPDRHVLTSFIVEALRFAFGAATTDLQPMSCQADGHGGISLMPVDESIPESITIAKARVPVVNMNQDVMKRELLRSPAAPAGNGESALNVQVGGNHYKHMPIQHVEFCQRNKLGWCESAAIKYLCRHQRKNGVEDVKKALHYVKLLAEIEYRVNLEAPKRFENATRDNV